MDKFQGFNCQRSVDDLLGIWKQQSAASTASASTNTLPSQTAMRNDKVGSPIVSTVRKLNH